MSSFNSSLLYDALNDSSITDLLDTVDSVKGLFNDVLIPQWFDADNVVNFYLNGSIDGSLEWNQYFYAVNCRAKTYEESREIAQAVFDRLNRADFANYHTNCNVLATVRPSDETDSYNSPIEVILKSRL